jgi:type I restriction enzyme S subunit
LASKAQATVAIAPVSNDRLPKGWRMVRFDELAQMVNERVDPSDTDADIYVGLEHLDSDTLKISRWGTPSDVIGDKLRFRTGDIIFGRRRAYQRKLAVAEFDGISSAHAMVVRANTNTVDPEFLPFLMQSDLFMKRAIDISVGSLSPTINWKTLRIQEFPLPPKDEQRRIADILWAADETVEAWRIVAADFRILSRAFRSQCVMAANHSRIALGECLEAIEPGKSVVGRNEPAASNAHGVLKVSAVGPDGFVPDENKTLIDDRDFVPGFAVHSDDLLITRSNTPDLVGRVCLVDRDYPNLMLCDKTLRLVPNSRLYSKQVLLEILRSDDVRAQIKGFANGTGGAMKNISQSSIRSIRIPLPNAADQSRIHVAICEIERVSRVLDKHLRSASATYTSLRDCILGGTSHVH